MVINTNCKQNGINNEQSSTPQVLQETQIREWGKHKPPDIPQEGQGAQEEQASPVNRHTRRFQIR
jgi:hypothetical protein